MCRRIVPRILIALLLPFLLACGEEATPLPYVPTASPTAIPTYTLLPPTPEPSGTASPTAIIVGPTSTLPPTATPPPTASPTIAATPTLQPTNPPRPTATSQPPQTFGSLYREVTIEQARNLGGYRALLPTYLPGGFKLKRLSVNEITNPRIVTVISDYGDEKGHTFYLNAQALPGLTAASGGSLPTPRPADLASPVGTLFRQEQVRVRGQTGLLTYTEIQTSLNWTEGITRYGLSGSISKEESLKIAESLA